ncbi:3-hydroxyacyl-ACP dehydratase FabZ [Pelagibaculum spongiae]|uniref:3-hydroxyacyl-[acyl-carrier-protein] dehydratase FabZ n=1 Tax=Pelagibaculum spongiae TaxID=2080658 RepID=A0A2V1GW04_9GAMM|nr:3-hydroxyacyl-ACP dehydratase FabZ [Pelagibaculum spongiae]PVZ64903.1 3-hydroxyacyl-[acyl-carrier-protein] dehydratase FabZ [Pelagibaculum spongiae]
MLIDVNQIKEVLPHRYPFLLIDRIISITENKKLVAIKNVTVNEPCFQGHFPGYPVMPGVLMIESMAQACALLGFEILKSRNEEKGASYLLTGVDGARFRRQVVPGDQLHLEVEYTKDRRGIWKFDCRATVDGELAVKAEITCAETDIEL